VRTASGMGALSLASLLSPSLLNAAQSAEQESGKLGLPGLPHFKPKAKRIIYLFQSGGPSHMDLFDYKPVLSRMSGQELPPSVRGTQRVTLMTRNQTKFNCFGSPFKFKQYGDGGAWFSELVSHMGEIADDICMIRSVHTEPINHDPAMTMMQTGFQLAGRPCMGSWLSYGLGSENADLPAFVVLISGTPQQPILSRYYHSGFLPSRHQGVQFQGKGDPVLFLTNPQGMSHENRGNTIDAIGKLNAIKHQQALDPEIEARIDSFELAYRMQTSVPELTDLSGEPQHILDMYGPEAKSPGSFASNALLARRLLERGVRFVQLFHAGWDQHGGLHADITRQTKQTDQSSAALLKDLKQRGLLEDTLIVWGGEFGRTSYAQGDPNNMNGRDHHPRCFSLWMAGAGIRPGTVYGSTDDFGYNLADNPVHVHDLHATMLHLFGIDHERLTYRFQGRDFRLTDVHGRIVRDIMP
jgi:hypothetical protein